MWEEHIIIIIWLQLFILYTVWQMDKNECRMHGLQTGSEEELGGQNKEATRYLASSW